jgi:rubrerythrin
MNMDALLAKTDHLVAQFEEHLNLAIQITDDPKLKVFLTHLLDEEQEHRAELAALQHQLQQASAPTH